MEPNTNVQRRLPYLILYVENLDRSVAFYQRLGIRVRDFDVASSMGAEAKALSIQGTTLILMSHVAGQQYFTAELGALTPTPGRAYPSFAVANLSEFHQATKGPGDPAIECVQEPREDAFGFVAIYRDPDGMLLSVIQPKADAESHGLVLSGGGALGSFELGVLQALAAKGTPIPRVITGTSVGAFNAAVLACELGMGRTLHEAVNALLLLWRNKVAGGYHDNGVFRLRGDAFRLMTPDLNKSKVLLELAGDAGFFTRDMLSRLAHAATSHGSFGKRFADVVDLSTLFSTQPLQDLVESSLSYENLLKSPAALKVATTDWQNGQLRLFSHLPEDHRSKAHKPRPENADITAANFHEVVRASTAIPGVFPAVDIDFGGDRRPFADGGLLMNSPLNPAIESQARTIHLICVNPLVEALPHDSINNSLETITQALVAAVAGFINSDLDHARLVNRIAGIVRRRHSDEFYNSVTIHRYHPQIGHLGGVAGLLDFTPEHVEELIHDGLEVGSAHDCQKAECVIPG